MSTGRASLDSTQRTELLAHLDAAGQARARYEAATDTVSRQAAVIAEQSAALAAARLLTSDTRAQHAILRRIYDLPDASAEEKLTALLDRPGR